MSLPAYLTANNHGAPMIVLFGANFEQPQHPTEPDKHAFMCYDGVGVYGSEQKGVICSKVMPDKTALAGFDRLVGPEIAAIRNRLIDAFIDIDEGDHFATRLGINSINFAISEEYMDEIRERIRTAAADQEPTFKPLLERR